MSVEITPASEADSETLLGFMRELYAFDHMMFDQPHATIALHTLLADSSLGNVWLVRDAGTPIGYCVLTFWYSLEFRGKTAFLDELYVSEAYRGKGIGGTIIDFLVDTCRKRSINALRLEVERKNLRAQEFYKKEGFETHDRYLMTKWIE